MTTPSNTEELMSLKTFIEKVESDTIFLMEKRLMASRERLSFLSDFSSFSPAEIRLNAQVFMWHGRMAAVFEEHKLIISEKKAQFEEGLKVRKRLLLQTIFIISFGISAGHYHHAIFLLKKIKKTQPNQCFSDSR